MFEMLKVAARTAGMKWFACGHFAPAKILLLTDFPQGNDT